MRCERPISLDSVKVVAEGTGTRKVLFLPGALGDGHFWHPVGELLPDSWDKRYFSWPGLGDQSSDPLCAVSTTSWGWSNAVRADDITPLIAAHLR